MSLLRADVHAVLAASTGLVALVGDRIFRTDIPQNTVKPYVAYRKVGAPREEVLTGPTGEEEARVEVACFGQDAAEAESVSEQVRGAMSGWRNLSLGVQRSSLVGEVDFFSEQVEAHQISLDFNIFHTE